jgi:hypothetical protein
VIPIGMIAGRCLFSFSLGFPEKDKKPMILCKSFHVKHIGLSSCFCNLENNHFALLKIDLLAENCIWK